MFTALQKIKKQLPILLRNFIKKNKLYYLMGAEDKMQEFDNIKCLNEVSKHILDKSLPRYQKEIVTARKTCRLVTFFVTFIYAFVTSFSLTYALSYFSYKVYVEYRLSYIINIIIVFIMSSIIGFLVIMSANSISDLVKGQSYKKHVFAYITDCLLTVLLLAESDPNNNDGLKLKQHQLWLLEEAAIVIERYLPIRLRSGNSVTDAWLKDTMKRVAAALREKMKWILTPKGDTHDYFVKSIAATLITIVEGNWDALEQTEPQKPTISFSLSGIANFLFEVLVLSIAVFVLYSSIVSNMTISGFSPAAVVLLVLVILSLSPNVSAVIANVKAISDPIANIRSLLLSLLLS